LVDKVRNVFNYARVVYPLHVWVFHGYDCFTKCMLSFGNHHVSERAYNNHHRIRLLAKVRTLFFLACHPSIYRISERCMKSNRNSPRNMQKNKERQVLRVQYDCFIYKLWNAEWRAESAVSRELRLIMNHEAGMEACLHTIPMLAPKSDIAWHWKRKLRFFQAGDAGTQPPQSTFRIGTPREGDEGTT
jgi:hypothetical protein